MEQIEYDTQSECFYLLGFLRADNEHPNNRRFVAKLINDKLIDLIIVLSKAYNECVAYIETVRMGSSKMALEYFKTNDIDFDNIKKLTIADLWKDQYDNLNLR